MISGVCQHCGHLWNVHNNRGCLQFIAVTARDDELCPCNLTPADAPKDHELFTDTVVNEQGGKQSRLDMDFTEIEPMMLRRVAAVLKQGKDKYGSKNWRNIPYEDHINHMLYHAIMANSDDTSEDHLASVICRAMFAMYMKRPTPYTYIDSGWAKEPTPQQVYDRIQAERAEAEKGFK